jgi:hypothetical protein
MLSGDVARQLKRRKVLEVDCLKDFEAFCFSCSNGPVGRRAEGVARARVALRR